nr:hypothetical protein [Tanacetum cinerariifolium]
PRLTWRKWGDQGACKVFGWLIGNFMEVLEVLEWCDGTLNDARTALDDRLKGIQMQYLPQAIWRSDKKRAAAMI